MLLLKKIIAWKNWNKPQSILFKHLDTRRRLLFPVLLGMSWDCHIPCSEGSSQELVGTPSWQAQSFQGPNVQVERILMSACVPIDQQGDFSLWSLLSWKPQGFPQEETEQKTGHTICLVHTVFAGKVQKDGASIAVIHMWCCENQHGF